MNEFPPVKEQFEIIKSGTVDIIPEDELLNKLYKSYKEKKPLKIKLGCDPSRPDLHIGHSVVLNKLRQFQDLGHEAILIIGDFTAMIGDPTGRKKARPQLSFEEAVENGKTYFEQAGKILHKDKIKILYNSQWLSKLSLIDLINILGKFTVQRILERDDFEKRLKEHQEISMHEILYPIMQGYDSYAIEADVEIGGTDQRFNNLVGRDMQKRYNMEPQVVITMPLLEGTDGSEKMSKSLGNAIGITDPPQDIFGKTMSIPDILIYKYFQLGTPLSSDELNSIRLQLEDEKNNPRDLKRRLGFELVKLYYDEETANKAIEEFDKIFIKKEIPDDISEYELENNEIQLSKLLVDTGLTSSMTESRKMIEQGAIQIDKIKINDVKTIIDNSYPSEFILQKGKRNFIKIIKKIPEE
ncbi:MAG TPA: tyrosine--tRNA ligase [Bacteroidetes bacterium]|nr:tyrosine--tRNA ligase [Bacteroidota bacterium]HCN37854.1 tyrosine--tRNA ligase [Bacteroidota bacterium]